MKIIFKIARAELRNIFYSPIAWLVLLAYYITAAAMITVMMEKFATFQEVGSQLDPNWAGFTGGIEKYILNETIPGLLNYVVLFLPLLTMGLISREVTNGTSKLLFSSPVTTSEIVLGKFLGMVVFNLFILCTVAFVLFSLSYLVDKSDILRTFSILLGFFLVMNAFAAIGLFLSSLTNYQIVAAMLTFMLFFLLANITSVWQQYDLMRDITFALSLQGKAAFLLYGLVTSRDLIYFLLIMILFIGFTVIRLNSMMHSGNKFKTFSRYGMLTVLVIILGYFSSRPGSIAYFDLTDNKYNTIHPVAQDALKKLDGSPLTVTLYTNLLGGNAGAGLPQSRTAYSMWYWGSYIRFYPNINLQYEYYYDIPEGDSSLYRQYPGKNIHQIAGIVADMLGIRKSIFKKPEEIRKLISLEDEMKMLVMQLEYKGKKTFLRTYRDATVWPNQENVTASIMRLSGEKEANVHFSTGHYERSAFNQTDKGYYAHGNSKEKRSSLINKGVNVDSINLTTGELKPGVGPLVVANPKTAYSQAEQEKIIAWLNNGGNAIIYTEPGKQEILAPVLKEIGVVADNGIMVRPNKHESPLLFTAKLTKAGNFIAKEQFMQLYQEHGLGGGAVLHDGVISLNFSATKGFKAVPMITIPGSDDIWIENDKLVADSAAPVFSATEGDSRKPEYVTAYTITRHIDGKEQRIIVAGDADFMSYQRTTNETVKIGLATYSYTLNNGYPPYVNAPMAQDLYLRISTKAATWMKYIYVYGISGAILLVSIIMLIRRKRK